MKVSVILVSYNGAAVLPRTLAALANVDVSGFEVEYLLVNNASTDETRMLFHEFLGLYPGLLIDEPRPGRSAALNAGLNVAKGDLVVFTDDDVLPKPGWLRAYVDAALKYPDLLAFAGQIRLDWPSPPPDWLARFEKSGRTLGATPIDRGETFVSATAVKGANSAVRRQAILIAGGFRTDLGVVSVGPPLAGEETYFFSLIQQAGHKILFVPDACLFHIVRPDQMAIWSLMQRGFRNGRGAAAIDDKPIPFSRCSLAGVPGYAVRQIVYSMVIGVVLFFLGDRHRGAELLLIFAEAVGYYSGRA